MIERRKYKRHRLVLATKITSLTDKSKYNLKMSIINVMNISLGGVGFCTCSKLEVDEFYQFCFKLPKVNEYIEPIVRIVRIQPHTDCANFYGGEFVGLTEYDKIKIKTYCILDKRSVANEIC